MFCVCTFYFRRFSPDFILFLIIVAGSYVGCRVHDSQNNKNLKYTRVYILTVINMSVWFEGNRKRTFVRCCPVLPLVKVTRFSCRLDEIIWNGMVAYGCFVFLAGSLV